MILLQSKEKGAFGTWASSIPFLRAGGFGREVFLRRQVERDPKDTRGIWKLPAPAYGLNGVPAAFRRALRRYMLNSVDSSARAGPKSHVSSLDPRLYFVSRGSGGVVGALTNYTN